MIASYIETFVVSGDQPYRFAVMAANGEIVSQSEGYLRSSDRDETARSLADQLGVKLRARTTDWEGR